MLYFLLLLSLVSFSFAGTVNELTGTFPIKDEVVQEEEEPSTGTFAVTPDKKESSKERLPSSEEKKGKKVPVKSK